ncbi:hypothetical protein EYF80_031260 [Liparis tanakae]|uniref:Uncharacterized protein n=1 Tax=Liparis tanakae TaxID=230148 RepID=A0A4Z2GY52_9TELE|nr:hypothetical protein EYF80_031260 [Liparis tanakae]
MEGLIAFARGHRNKRCHSGAFCYTPYGGIPVGGYPQGRGSDPPGDRHSRLPLLKVDRSRAEQDFQKTVCSQYLGVWSHRPCT